MLGRVASRQQQRAFSTAAADRLNRVYKIPG